MRSMLALLKKEIMEQLRSGRLMFLGILFVLFGIMNPAIAKATPWLLEAMADSLASSGLNVTTVTVSAMDSWVQFYKNMPMALLAFLLLQSSTFTKEYQTGTLILSLTKGLPRYQVVLSKTVVLTALWSLGYWLCFGITYGYNAFFWDNSVALNLTFSAVCWWQFGAWVIALMILFSVFSRSNTGVLLGTGGCVLASYVLGLFAKLKPYMPTMLSNGNALIYGTAEAKTYLAPLLISVVLGIVCIAASIPVFNKKQL